MSQYHPHEIPIRGKIEDAHIKFVFKDSNGRTERTFESVHRLADFLRYNQPLAEVVGYVPKTNDPIDFNSLIVTCDLIYHNFIYDHQTYVSTANTQKLNRFFGEERRNLYNIKRVGNDSLSIESSKVIMLYTHNTEPAERKLSIEFKLKSKT